MPNELKLQNNIKVDRHWFLENFENIEADSEEELVEMYSLLTK